MPDDMTKSYVGTLAGSLNPLKPQELVQQTSPPAGPDHTRPSPQPDNTQPGETIAGSDGSMVTASPSSSGTGQMILGAGTRAPNE